MWLPGRKWAKTNNVNWINESQVTSRLLFREASVIPGDFLWTLVQIPSFTCSFVKDSGRSGISYSHHSFIHMIAKCYSPAVCRWLISPRLLKSLPYRQDQLQDLQCSMQNENAEPFIQNYWEFQDDDSIKLSAGLFWSWDPPCTGWLPKELALNIITVRHKIRPPFIHMTLRQLHYQMIYQRETCCPGL